jgi:hypothetical protein
MSHNDATSQQNVSLFFPVKQSPRRATPAMQKKPATEEKAIYKTRKTRQRAQQNPLGMRKIASKTISKSRIPKENSEQVGSKQTQIP